MTKQPDDPKTIIKRRGPDQKLWYVVAHASDMTIAAIPAGLLRSAGIPVYLFREAVGSAIPVTVGKMGGVDVAVPEAYYEEASALLEADEDDDDRTPDGLLTPPSEHAELKSRGAATESDEADVHDDRDEIPPADDES